MLQLSEVGTLYTEMVAVFIQKVTARKSAVEYSVLVFPGLTRFYMILGYLGGAQGQTELIYREYCGSLKA